VVAVASSVEIYHCRGNLRPTIMTIYRTRYRDPNERWVSAWAETHVAAEFLRALAEKRFAPRKIEAQIDRFEVNPSKPELVRFLNEHSGK
jgi:hypothetical protein